MLSDLSRFSTLTRFRFLFLVWTFCLLAWPGAAFTADSAAQKAGSSTETVAQLGNFQHWITTFYAQAAQKGISRATYDAAFAHIKRPDLKVLFKAQYQPEFTVEIWDYLDSRGTPSAVKKGQKLAQEHEATLAAVHKQFGVRPSLVLAIWSMETNYGSILKKSNRLHNVIQALATLAWGDKRRSGFAKNQLIAALQILQSGDIPVDQMRGSWAGAMGHTQFIPTSYLAYGVDMDGDKHRDIWNSIPDALGTAASLLKNNGWRSGKTWGYEVRIPAGFAVYEEQTKTLAQWQKMGVLRISGSAFPRPEDRAVLKLLAGEKGPAFLMLKNFYVIKKYNNSDFYALAVGLLADQIAGFSGLQTAWPRPPGSLQMAEKLELQCRLKALGLYEGKLDGQLGKGSRAGIRAFQKQHNARLREQGKKATGKADGIPSTEVLQQIRPITQNSGCSLRT